MSVLIDSREPSEYQQAVRHRFGRDGVDTTTERLPTGDYAWATERGDVWVERKTVRDLMNSLNDGRWHDQMTRMIEIPFPVVLVEGRIDAQADGTILDRGRVMSGWNVDRLDNALLTIQQAGILLAYSPSGYNPVSRRIVSLYNYSHREDHALGSRKVRYALDSPERLGIELLSSFPGIGTATARQLLREYGSLGFALTAILEGKVAVKPSYESRFSAALWTVHERKAKDDSTTE